jgi:hypothetical protein
VDGELVVVTGLACLAGMCAYLITAAEMGRHYSDRREPRRQSLRTALVTGAVFESLGLLVFWLAPRLT